MTNKSYHLLPRDAFAPFALAVLLLTVFSGQRFYALSGVAAGTVAGMLKTVCFSRLIKETVARKLAGEQYPGCFILPYVAALITLTITVVLAINIHIWAFTGVLAGLAVVLFSTMIRTLKYANGEGRV